MLWLLSMIVIAVATLAIGAWLYRADRAYANRLTPQHKRTLNYLTQQMRDNHVSGD